MEFRGPTHRSRGALCKLTRGPEAFFECSGRLTERREFQMFMRVDQLQANLPPPKRADPNAAALQELLGGNQVSRVTARSPSRTIRPASWKSSMACLKAVKSSSWRAYRPPSRRTMRQRKCSRSHRCSTRSRAAHMGAAYNPPLLLLQYPIRAWITAENRCPVRVARRTPLADARILRRLQGQEPHKACACNVAGPRVGRSPRRLA
jgi:hypothetical protein